jgi:hypothetical protein
MERRGFIRRNIRTIAIAAVILIVAAAAYFWYRSSQPYQPTQADWDRANIVSTRFQAEIHNLGADQRLPASVREKLLAVIRDNQTGKVEFSVDGLPHPEGDRVIMSAETAGPKPRIIVMAPLFMEMANTQSPDLFRSTVLTALLHEYIHLDKWPQTRPPTEEERLDEEVRAYGKMCLEVVRPMRQAGLAYLYDYAKLDDLLRRCGDNPQCPEFREAIRLYINGQPVPAAGIR